MQGNELRSVSQNTPPTAPAGAAKHYRHPRKCPQKPLPAGVADGGWGSLWAPHTKQEDRNRMGMGMRQEQNGYGYGHGHGDRDGDVKGVRWDVNGMGMGAGVGYRWGGDEIKMGNGIKTWRKGEGGGTEAWRGRNDAEIEMGRGRGWERGWERVSSRSEKHTFRRQLALAQPHWTQVALESAGCLSLPLLSQGAVLLSQPTVPAGFYFTFIFLMAWVA